MNLKLPSILKRLAYEEYAEDYLESLPLEHFMESVPQATQRKITVQSLDLVHLRRPEVQVFSELLVQYPLPDREKPGQVVPDNMVVVSKQPIEAELSYDVELQPARPFWVLEYVARRTTVVGCRLSGRKGCSPPRQPAGGKDYKKSFRKYEQELKVPFCLTFDPDKQDLRLHRHTKGAYVRVQPNRQGRLPLKRLDLQVGLLDGWARFWYQGELLPLGPELLRELDEVRQQAAQAQEMAAQAQAQAVQAQEMAVQAQEMAAAEKRRADELQQQLEAAQRELAELRSRLPRSQKPG